MAVADNYWLGSGGTAGDLTSVGNWSTGAAPANTVTSGASDEDVYFQGSQSITSNLGGLSAVTLGHVEFLPSYSGTVGTVDDPLKLDCQTFKFAGTGRAYIEFQDSLVTLEILNTASVSQTHDAGLFLATASGATVTNLIVQKGNVYASIPGETTREGTFTNVYVGYDTQQASDSKVILGRDAAVTNLRMQGGQCISRVNLTDINLAAGVLQMFDSATIGTLDMDGGTCIIKSDGTITTINLAGGSLDFTRDMRAKTVTTLNYSGGTLRLDADVVTLTNDINPQNTLSIVATPI